MTIQFKPAQRENIPQLIGLAGGTGSGKTYTALRLATGLAGGKPIAFIDTENKRAKHYADEFKFEHADMRAPFRPQAYIDHIMAAQQAGFGVAVIDSTSHIWAGDGGILDWQEEELDRMAADDWKKREACKMAAWIKPKMAHKEFVTKLLQLNMHVIMCFRAEEKIDMIRENGKTKIVPKETMTGLNGWVPICEKNLPFELTMSLLFTADKPGIPKPIKLPEKLRSFFPLDQVVTEKAGQQLAAWSAGAATAESPRREAGVESTSSAASPDLLKAGEYAAQGGVQAYVEWRDKLSAEDKEKIRPHNAAWSKLAKESDEANKY